MNLFNNRNNSLNFSGFFNSSAPVVEEFIFKIDTSLGDGLAEFQFNPIHLVGSIDYIIDWGDSYTQNITSNTSTTHNYNTGGIYIITISINSGIKNWAFYNSVDKQKLISVNNWGTCPVSLQLTFSGLLNFQISALDLPNVLYGDNSGTFKDCTNFNSSLENFPFVGRCDRVLYNCINFNNNLNVNTTSCYSMVLAFFNIDSFNNPISFDSSLVQNMNSLFYACNNFNKSIGFLNLSSLPNGSDFGNFLTYTSYDNLNYQNDIIELIGWNGLIPTKTIPINCNINFGTAKYEIGGQSEYAKNYLINTLGWTISDGGGI
jgi:hypothetical protein